MLTKLILIMALLPAIVRAALLVGIDLTVEPFEEKEASFVAAWVDHNAVDGETVQVLAITGKTLTKAKVLAEVKLPDRPGVNGKARAAKIDELKQALEESLSPKRREEYRRQGLFKQSRIADFFIYAATSFDSLGSKGKIRKYAIWSDMLEVHDGANWEAGTIVAEHIRIPKLSGSIEIRGVQSDKYSDSEMWQTARGVWSKALSDAGLKVRSYSSSH